MKASAPPLTIILTLALCLLWPTGCTPTIERSQLEHIEAIIDRQPDSAKVYLAQIDSAALTSAADKALYHMLRNLATYKSFDDSLDEDALNYSTGYFIRSKDYRRASTTLYLLGNLYLARNKYGPAAVLLTRGMEYAGQAGDVYNQGLLAMSMWGVYGRTYDSNRQITSAKQALEAFNRIGRDDWAAYALLNLADAYHTNGRLDSVIIISDRILDLPIAADDTTLLCSANELRALAALASGRDSLAVVSYANALRYDESALYSGAPHNIALLLAFVTPEKVSDADRSILQSYIDKKNQPTPADVLAKSHNYKEAYRALEQYRHAQDSFIQELMSRSVDSSIEEYHIHKSELLKAELKSTRKTTFLIIVSLTLLVLLSISLGRYYIIRQRREIQEKVLLAEHLQESLKSIHSEKMESIENLTEANTMLSDLLKSKYKLLEEFCFIVISNANAKTSKQKIAAAFTSLLQEFSIDKDRIAEMENQVNRIHDNLISDFHADFPNLKEPDSRLFLFSVLGLSSPVIALLLGEEKVSSVYDRKRHLKDKIRRLNPPKKDKYLHFLS